MPLFRKPDNLYSGVYFFHKRHSQTRASVTDLLPLVWNNSSRLIPEIELFCNARQYSLK